MALLDTGGRTPGCVLDFSASFHTNHNKYLCDFVSQITTKLCGANVAQRSLRPNERIVMRFLFNDHQATHQILEDHNHFPCCTKAPLS